MIIIYLHLPYHNVTRRKGSAQQLVGVAGGREGGSPVIREPFAIFVSFVLSLGRTTFFSFLRFVRRGIPFVRTRARGVITLSRSVVGREHHLCQPSFPPLSGHFMPMHQFISTLTMGWFESLRVRVASCSSYVVVVGWSWRCLWTWVSRLRRGTMGR